MARENTARTISDVAAAGPVAAEGSVARDVRAGASSDSLSDSVCVVWSSDSVEWVCVRVGVDSVSELDVWVCVDLVSDSVVCALVVWDTVVCV